MTAHRKSKKPLDLALLPWATTDKEISQIAESLDSESASDAKNKNKSFMMWIHQLLVALGLPVSSLSPASLNELINFMKRRREQQMESHSKLEAGEHNQTHHKAINANAIDFSNNSTETIEAQLVDILKRLYVFSMQHSAFKEKSAARSNEHLSEEKQIAEADSALKNKSLFLKQAEGNAAKEKLLTKGN